VIRQASSGWIEIETDSSFELLPLRKIIDVALELEDEKITIIIDSHGLDEPLFVEIEYEEGKAIADYKKLKDIITSSTLINS
jgi:hypothetical protein